MTQYKLKDLSKTDLHQAPTAIRLLFVRFPSDQEYLQSLYKRFPDYFEEVPKIEKVPFYRWQQRQFFTEYVRPAMIKFRTGKGFSKAEMCDQIGVHKEAVHRYETGEQVPSMKIMLKIMKLIKM